MEIVGKTKLRSYFERLAETRSYRQFYIFEGADGVGKKTFADYLAATIHCTGSTKPCGTCPSCVKHSTDNHPDYVRIENDDSDKDKKNITVDTIRRHLRDMYVKPLISDTKIYLIDDEKPIAPEGQNAFLKILEEPPSYVLILMLVKNCASLLDTVRSRGVLCRIDPCTIDETLYFINKYYPSTGARAKLIAAFSGGILGKAKSLAEGDSFFSLRDDFYNTLSIFPLNQAEALKESVSFVLKHKESLDDILNLLLSWLRDVVCMKTADEKHIINSDFKDKLTSFCSGITTEKVIQTAEAAEDMSKLFSKGNNLELWSLNMFKNLI